MSDRYWQDESKYTRSNWNPDDFDITEEDIIRAIENLRKFTPPESCPHKNAQDLDLRANLKYCPDCEKVV